MNSSEIEVAIKEKNEKMIKYKDNLEPLLVEKHNMELKLMELSETIRKGRKLISKTRVELEMLENEKWVALRQERGY